MGAPDGGIQGRRSHIGCGHGRRRCCPAPAKAGRDVILVDRHPLAGEETSFGNAGGIECASVFPYMFPREFGQILQYALNRSPQVRYQISDLPTFLPWLVRYFLASSPKRTLHSAMAELPFIRRSVSEHQALMQAAQVP